MTGYLSNPPPGVQLNLNHPLSRGLVGCWLFNEGSGLRANDLSGEQNVGTLTSFEPFSSTQGWRGGDKGGASLQFNGTSTYVDCGNRPSLDITSAFTISAALNVPVTGIVNRILGKNNAANSAGWGIDTRPGGQFSLAIKKDTSTNFWYEQGDSLINDNKWHNVTAVYRGDGSTPSLYVDGRIQALTVVSVAGNALSGFTDSGENMTIGRSHLFAGSFNFYTGFADNVKLWNRALSNTEVQNHSAQSFSMFTFRPSKR